MSGTRLFVFLLRRLFVAGLLAAALPATADDAWPSRPIRMIVPYPAGGSNDIIGRMVSAQLSDRLGKQVYVDNRAGAGSTIGVGMGAAAAPDGYTLIMISAAYVFNPSIYKKLPYDPATAFTPITLLGSGPVALLVTPSMPVKTVGEFVALARSKPGQMNFATAGVGSLQHLASELFRIQAGLDMVHVPYKGGGPAMMDVASGQAQMTMASILQCLSLIRDGQLKALGTSGLKRSAVLPNIPTIDESGLKGFEAANWWGLLAPAGTPQPIIDRLYREIAEILASAETRKRLESEGAEAAQMDPPTFGRFLTAETEKWNRVVKQVGITPE